jgi:hypothetical protein
MQQDVIQSHFSGLVYLYLHRAASIRKAFRDEDGTLYDVTYFTPKTSFSLRKHVCGQRVEQFPSISEEESDGKDDASNTISNVWYLTVIAHAPPPDDTIQNSIYHFCVLRFYRIIAFCRFNN